MGSNFFGEDVDARTPIQEDVVESSDSYLDGQDKEVSINGYSIEADVLVVKDARGWGLVQHADPFRLRGLDRGGGAAK